MPGVLHRHVTLTEGPTVEQTTQAGRFHSFTSDRQSERGWAKGRPRSGGGGGGWRFERCCTRLEGKENLRSTNTRGCPLLEFPNGSCFLGERRKRGENLTLIL